MINYYLFSKRKKKNSEEITSPMEDKNVTLNWSLKDCSRKKEKSYKEEIGF